MPRLGDLRLACILVLLLSLPLAGQQASAVAPVPGGACVPPSFSKVVNDRNIFNEQQEEWLGEILENDAV